MRRTIAVLALPVMTLSLAAVLLAGQSGSVNGSGPGEFGPVPRTTADIRRVDAGAPIAVTKTNWQETGDGSVTIPVSPPGRPGR